MTCSTEQKLTPEARILLLCARTRLTPTQTACIAELSGEVSDWDSLVAKTVPHRFAALTLHHIKPFLKRAGAERALRLLKKHALEQTACYLRLSAAQKKLNDLVLAKTDIPHVFMKGVGLAEQLYPVPSQRVCRDIDVWVHPDAMADLWKRLEKTGYTRLAKPDQTHRIPVRHAARLLPTVDVISPNGVLIEFHMRYDQSGLTIDPIEMHARAELLETSIGSFRVPQFEDHFMYICQHHTRHLWSRLRWLVDLDAFEQSKRFNKTAILKQAEKTPLMPTVEACLELSESLSSPACLTASCRTIPATNLKAWILRCTMDGPDAAHEAQISRKSPDFPFRWQYGWGHRVQLNLKKLEPTHGDYLAMPLQRRHWWRYYFTRPFRLLHSTLMRDGS